MTKFSRFSLLFPVLTSIFVINNANAASFQLWEQSVSSIGNYHAGYAAEAADASIAWFNPAGITLFKHQQAVFGGVGVTTSFKYLGTVGINTINNGAPMTVTAQGGTFGFVPNLHYVAPISDRVGFGFSIDVPFGLKTDYGRSTAMRYAATLTSVSVLDISPDLALRLAKKWSVGAGFDIQRMSGDFNLVAGSGTASNDTVSYNRANGTGYGYHVGILYELSQNKRIGISYHSQVVHHLTGTSKFIGPIADSIQDIYDLPPGPIVAERASVNVTLPAYTALSIYDKFKPRLAVMASLIYTQWNVFQNLNFKNIAGVDTSGFFPVPSNTIPVTIPEHYSNSWNAALGLNYDLTDEIILKSGVGYDQSPVSSVYRNVQLPDNDRYVISFGAHFQTYKQVGFDLGWSHVFLRRNTKVNPPPQSQGLESIVTNGSVNGGADVYGAQVTWDMS